MSAKEQILDSMALFSLGTGGIGNWITEETEDFLFEKLANLKAEPISYVQLNQLLVRGHQAPMSQGYFTYYFNLVPTEHPYEVSKLPHFSPEWQKNERINDLEHLKWGLYRIYVDSLLFYGNVRYGYRTLRTKSLNELEIRFRSYLFDTDGALSRGPALPLASIAKDDRYLISEMACKTYGEDPEKSTEFLDLLVEAYREHKKKGAATLTIANLLDGDFIKKTYEARQREFEFSADDVLRESVSSEDELREKILKVYKKFTTARNAALENTKNYLSMVGDLDVYVATSMRTRANFRDMADNAEKIFAHERLRPLNLRYFDPTLSAASGHEDKGLIECLMVKCAKVLVYCAGDRESYGKDAEAAMALSLGKPVIFLCEEGGRSRFYREVHPLSRLIDFSTGVTVGAIVTDKLEDVSELLARIFANKMEYELKHNPFEKRGYIRLQEKLTDSTVRLQTNDMLLNETFWNHYHNV